MTGLWSAPMVAAPARSVSASPQRAKTGRPKPDPRSAEVDVRVRAMMRALGIPGLSLAIVQNGKTIKVQGYGLANVEHNVPARPQTVYLLASITKSFTATAIMQLVEARKLALTDPITKHLPEAPEAWRGITLRQLLTHTAGLKDRFEGSSAEEWLLSYSTERLYRAARETPTDSPPGTRWQYSDQGYFLLGMILERVTGKSYRRLLTEQIFRPLGMRATTTVQQEEIIENRASGYTREGARLLHNHRRTDYGLVSHFGLLSTVSDLARWAAALDGGTFLKRETLASMWTPAALDDGSEIHTPMGAYGFGWFLDERNGHRIVHHGGSTGTAFWHLPEDRLTVIVLTNLEALAGGDAVGIAKQIAALYAPDATWAAMTSQPDPDPTLTAALKAEILRLGEGKPDLTCYTASYGPAVQAAAEQQAEFYRNIGPLERIVFLGERKARARGEVGQGRIRFYRAVYRRLTLHYTVGLGPDGKITSLMGEP
jgi:D-alanyl-D-alanine carboxypeptidase